MYTHMNTELKGRQAPLRPCIAARLRQHSESLPTLPGQMSAVSVRVVQSSTDSSGDAGAGPAEAAGVDPELLEVLPFSSGTVQALRTFGVVHLYRPTPAPEATATTGAQGAPQPLTLPVTDTVCALGVPGSLSLADFCAFVGAMLPRVKDMRVIRDERGHPAARGALDAAVGHPLLAGQEAPVFTYSVLLRFDAASSAEEFFRFYHGRAVRLQGGLCSPRLRFGCGLTVPGAQFNSLEPDVCHLLFVKDVEFTSHASQPPPGLTVRLDTPLRGLLCLTSPPATAGAAGMPGVPGAPGHAHQRHCDDGVQPRIPRGMPAQLGGRVLPRVPLLPGAAGLVPVRGVRHA